MANLVQYRYTCAVVGPGRAHGLFTVRAPVSDARPTLKEVSSCAKGTTNHAHFMAMGMLGKMFDLRNQFIRVHRLGPSNFRIIAVGQQL